MCFNPAITWGTAGLGIATFILAKVKQKPASLYFPPLYFGFMDILQGLMYIQLGPPSILFLNILVYTAYIHVCFQPLVFNFWLGSFIQNQYQQIYRYTLKLCFVAGLFLLYRMFVTAASPLCSSYETLCHATPTIFYGEHHIAWALPLLGAGWHYITPSIALHMFLFFIPGLFMGLYRLMLIFFFLGPYLAAHITANPSEQSSIWCVMGLWLLAITIISVMYYPPRFLFPTTSAKE
jgi:hypothetical protein